MNITPNFSTSQATVKPIVTNTIQNPPKLFTYTIPAGAIETIFYDYDFLRILSLSDATGITLRFGDSGTPTDVIGAGIGFKLEQPVRSVAIANNSGSPTTITVAMTIGEIFDDRLNVSGAVDIQNTASDPLFVMTSANNADQGAISAPAGASTLVIAGSSDTMGVLMQNVGTVDIYVSTTNDAAIILSTGFILQPNAFFEWDIRSSIYANVASGTGLLRRARKVRP